MPDSLTDFKVYRRPDAPPIGEVADSVVGWTELTDGTGANPVSPVSVKQTKKSGRYWLDDTTTPNPTFYYKVIEKTTNAVTVPYNVVKAISVA